jgi:hypothetical protein
MKTKFAGFICLFFLTGRMHALAVNGPATINQKLVKAFQDAFPLAEKVDWKETADYYFVHFKENNILSEIEYDHGGNFLWSERYYRDADLLPLHLAWELHQKYSDKTIYGITELNNGDDTSYFVKLEGSKDWTTVKCSADGILEVVDKLNKQ